MTSPTIQERTARAEAALVNYIQAAEAQDEALIDLLTDLMHWANGQGLDVKLALDHAEFHFDEEVRPPRSVITAPSNDIMCELAHELTVRECASKQILLDVEIDEETNYSPDAQCVFDEIYEIVSRVLETKPEVQP